MAFTLSQPSYGQAGSYTAVQDRFLIRANANNLAGVRSINAPIAGVMQGNMAVSANASPASTVSVSSGDVWINGGTGQGYYYAFNDAALNSAAFASNSSGNPRIDLVVVQVTDTGLVAPSVALDIVQGTPAVSPTAPATPTKALALAQVLIPNGFVSGTTLVLAANITDVRTRSAQVLANFPSASTAAQTVGHIIHDHDKGNLQSFNAWAIMGTSTTALTVATGSKVFTTQSGLPLSAGKRVRAYSLSALNNYVTDTTTSVTSNTIGTGSKTFTVGAGLAYVIGTRVRVYQTTTPANFMEGAVTSYSSTTLVVNVDATGGSGTIAAWTVSPTLVYMEGATATYSSTTLTITMDTIVGGGTAVNPTFADWVIYGPDWEQPVKAETTGTLGADYRRYVPTVVSPSTVSPSVPFEGGLWYQTDTDRLLSYTGTSWQRVAYNSATGRTGGRWSIPLATPQSLTTGTAAFMSWTVEAADSDGFLAIPSTTFTVPAGLDGQYVVSCSLIWSGDPTGNVAAPNSNNASTLIVWNIGAVEYTTNCEVSKGSVYNNRTGVTGFATLAAGDSFQIRARQVSGGTLTAYGILNVARIGV